MRGWPAGRGGRGHFWSTAHARGKNKKNALTPYLSIHPGSDDDDDDEDDNDPSTMFETAASIGLPEPDDGWAYPFEEAEFTRVVPAFIGGEVRGGAGGAAGGGTIIFVAPPQADPGWASADVRRVVGRGGGGRGAKGGRRPGGRGRIAAASAGEGGSLRVVITRADDAGAGGAPLELDDTTPALAMDVGGDALLAMLLSSARGEADRRGSSTAKGKGQGSSGNSAAPGGRRRRGAAAAGAAPPPARRLPPLALDILAAILARAGRGAPGGLGDAGRTATGRPRRVRAAEAGAEAAGAAGAPTSATPPPPPPPPPKKKKQAWGLVRAAITDYDPRMKAFTGRLFFGDPASGAVAWECEARPADAAWLADRAGAPLLVRRDVFAGNAVPLGSLVVSEEGEDGGADEEDEGEGEEGGGMGEGPGGRGPGGGGRRRRGRRGRGAAPAASPPPPPASSSGPAPIRPGDPPAVILLKRSLEVAVKEEDFAAAAALRDSPVLRAARAAEDAADAGDAGAAAEAEARLAALLEEAESGGGQEAAGAGAGAGAGAAPNSSPKKRRGRPPRAQQPGGEVEGGEEGT